MGSIVSAQTHTAAGRVRPLAGSGAKRSAALPNVPTSEELGIRGMDFSNRFGVFAPTGTPPDIMARLNRALNTIVEETRRWCLHWQLQAPRLRVARWRSSPSSSATNRHS